MLLTTDNTRKYIEELILRNTNFSTGIAQLKKILQNQSAAFFLDNIDQLRLQGQFKNWISTIRKEGPVPSHIHTFYFQLISTTDPENDNNSISAIQVYGTAFNPGQTELWYQLTETCFLPENRFFVPEDFRTLESNLKKISVSPELAFFIFEIMLVLLVFNIRKVIYKLFPSSDSDLFISAGRENGDIYSLLLPHRGR